MTEFQSLLGGLFTAHSVPWQPAMLEQLEQYAALLREWNERMNLTAITEPGEVAVKHFLDSALALRFAPASGRVVDVGTGAGFPGMVWAILRPGLQVTLLDSLNKRLLFLEEVCRALGVPAVLVHDRAEEGGRRPQLREAFDAATARAVAPMNVLAEYCLPFVKRGGCFVALKGPQLDGELKAAARAVQLLGAEVEHVEEYALPGGDQRRVAVLRRCRPLPAAYPRAGGKIKKAPL